MDALRRDIHIPQAFIVILLWIGQKVSSFQVTKTSVNNKRFLICLQTDSSDCGAKVLQFLQLCKYLCRKKSTYPFGMGSVSLRIRANGYTECTRVTGRERKEYSARRDVQRGEEYPTTSQGNGRIFRRSTPMRLGGLISKEGRKAPV